MLPEILINWKMGGCFPGRGGLALSNVTLRISDPWEKGFGGGFLDKLHAEDAFLSKTVCRPEVGDETMRGRPWAGVNQPSLEKMGTDAPQLGICSGIVETVITQ